MSPFRNLRGEGGLTRLILWTLGLGLVLPAWAFAGEDAMRLSYRGVRAYEAGHYALAESFFEKSVREALLKGQKEEAAKASANWVDVLMETGQSEKAHAVLKGLGEVPESQQALFHWKQGQVYLAMERPDLALQSFESALVLRPPSEWLGRVNLDKTRAEWLAGDSVQPQKTAEQMARGAPALLRPGWQALLADMWMAQGRYSQSDSLLEKALKGYRDGHRYARTTVLLWRQAACASALGQKERSLRILKEALTIATELGIGPGGLEKMLVRFTPQLQDLDIAKSPSGNNLDWQGKNRDATGSLKLEPQNANDKSVSLPLDGVIPR
jgi:tetratricopeptide (TPR) repeat protein